MSISHSIALLAYLFVNRKQNSSSSIDGHQREFFFHSENVMQNDMEFTTLEKIKEFVSFSEDWLHTFHSCECWEVESKLTKTATTTTTIKTTASILETSPHEATELVFEAISAKLPLTHVVHSYSFVLRALEYAVATLHLLIADKQTHCAECAKNDVSNLPHDINAWHISAERNELHTVKGVLMYYQAMWHGSHHATSSLATMKEHGIWQRQSAKAASALLLESISLSPHYLYRQLLANSNLQNKKENNRWMHHRVSDDNVIIRKQANTHLNEYRVKKMENESVDVNSVSKFTRFERPYLIDNNWDEIDYPSLTRGQIKELMTWITSESALTDDDSASEDNDGDNSFIDSEKKRNRKKGRTAMAEVLFVNHVNNTYKVEREPKKESSKWQQLSLQAEKKPNKQSNSNRLKRNENNRSTQSVNISNANESLNQGLDKKDKTSFTELHSNNNNNNNSNFNSSSSDTSDDSNDYEKSKENIYDDDDNDDGDDDNDDDDEEFVDRQERPYEEVERYLRSVHALLISASLQISNAKSIPFDAEVAKGLILMALRRLRYTCDVTFAQHVIDKAKSFNLDVNKWPIRGVYRTNNSFQWDRDELKKLESEVELAQIACHVPQLRKRFHAHERVNVNSDMSAMSKNVTEIAAMTLPKRKVYQLLQKGLLSLSYVNMLDRQTSLQSTSYAMLSLRLSKSVYLQGVARAQHTWAAVIRHTVKRANSYLYKLRHVSLYANRDTTAAATEVSPTEWKCIVLSFNIDSLLRRAITWEEEHQEWVSERLLRARLAQFIKQAKKSNHDNLFHVINKVTLQRLTNEAADFCLTLPSFAESGLIRQETLVFIATNAQMLNSRAHTNSNNLHFEHNFLNVKEGNVLYESNVDSTTDGVTHNAVTSNTSDNSEQGSLTKLNRQEEPFSTTENYEEHNTDMEMKFYMSLMEEMLMDVYNINLSKVHNDLCLEKATRAHCITKEQLHLHVNFQLLLSALSLWKESKQVSHIIDNTRVSEHISDAFYLICELLRSYELQMHNSTLSSISVMQSMRWLALNSFQSIIFAEQTFLPKESDSVTSYCNRLSRFVQKHLHTTHGLSQRVEHGLMSDDEPTGVSHGMNRFIDNNPLIHRTLMLLRNAQQIHIERGELSTLLHTSDLDAYLDDKQQTMLSRIKHKLSKMFLTYFTETADEQMLRELGLLLLPSLSHSSESSSVKRGRSSTWRASSVPYFHIDAKEKVSSAKFINYYLDQCSISSTFRKFVIATQLASLALQSGKPQAFSFIMHEALGSRQNTLNLEFSTDKPTTPASCKSKSTSLRTRCEMEKMWQTYTFTKRKNNNANLFLVSIADFLANDVWDMITASAWQEEHFAAQWHYEKTRQRMLHLPFSLDRHTPFHYSSSEERQELLTYIDRWRARWLLLRNLLITSENTNNNYYYDNNNITHSCNNNMITSESNDRNNDNSDSGDRKGTSISTELKTYEHSKGEDMERVIAQEVSWAADENVVSINSNSCLFDAYSSAFEILSRCTSYLWFVAWKQHATNTRKQMSSNTLITMSPSPFDGMHFPAGSVECGIDLYTYFSLLDQCEDYSMPRHAKTQFVAIKKLRLTLLSALEDLTSRLRYYYKLTLEKPRTLLQSSVKDLDIIAPLRNSNTNRQFDNKGKSIDAMSRASDVDSNKENNNNNIHDHDNAHTTFLVEPWNQITNEEYSTSTLANGEGVHYNQRLHRLSGVRWGLYVLRMCDRAKKWWLSIQRFFVTNVVEAESAVKDVSELEELFDVHDKRA